MSYLLLRSLVNTLHRVWGPVKPKRIAQAKEEFFFSSTYGLASATSNTKEDLYGKWITVPSTSPVGHRGSLTTGTIGRIVWSWALKSILVFGKTRCAIGGFRISVNGRPTCSSETSFADCETQQVVVNCSFPQNYCSKERNSTQDNDEQAAVFYKGCTSADRCTEEMKDTVECCKNNLCNKDITCYHCTSNVSFAGCARKQTEVTCTLPRSRCVKVEYSSNGNHQTFYKGCATTKDCEATSDKSFVDCCDDNFCNKESELSCFKCSSTVSHDECQKRRQEHVCRSSKDDRCYYASMQQTSQDGSSVTKHFEYGCTNNLHCNNTGKFFAGCDEPSNACQVRCCGKNLCNEVDSSEEQVLDFLNEISQMKLLAAHPNIVSLVGCSTLCKHKFLVLEYVPYGDLLEWLRKKRKSNHLADRGFVHRDLAARNVLVGNDDRVKVSDFGLMRQVYEDVYTIKKTKKLPIKWMAPESIYYSVFTTKSDVWSYGVLLWEMATMGGVPYPTLTNSQLCKLLKTGYLMGRPDMCSDEVYDLMTECWRENPTTRPSFPELISRLEEIMTRDEPYCDLNNYDETSPWYSAAPETSEETE
ncbi:Fibroblast growth factor receptor 2 [Stylophora pistillata]|uniref:Fibroblast growth factor receptor 2 n=1 Tax=Stylophora pistillata TaxID=50429 RepID=A0A2B4RWQ3_STYPI|nr:Fibroblast growth factor receptor 2 [Stylophora pistillata]